MNPFLLAMTINIAGLSAHSCIALDKYINQNDISVVTISESYGKFQGFDNYDIYRAPSDKHGSSLLMHKKLGSYEVKIPPRKGVDSCFAVIKIGKRKFMFGSIYVNLGNTVNIENGTAILTETYNFCKNENLLGPIILGDWNSRHPFWGDKVDNKYGKILSDYCADHQFSIISPHYPTFVSAQNNGSSVIDFCITQQSCSDLISNARVIEDTEFFSGAPEQGHWPVIFDLDLPVKCDNPKRCVLNYKMADWEDISIQLEEMVVKNMDSMIREAPTKALVTFMDLVKEICEKTIPRKTVCKYSKPYWTKKLTYLSNKLKEARKKYRLQCNPENKNIVDLAKKELKREINLNNTRWTQNGIMQMNEGNAKTFFDNIRKFNGSMSSNNVGVLRHEGKTIDKDVQKASVFQSVFFDGAHLTGKLFDEAFYEKTKNEVKESLSHTVWDYYRGEVKNNLNVRITMDELKLAIKKTKTNNKGVDPYGLHPKLLKKFKFNTISICLHLINNAFLWVFGHLIKL